MGGQNFWNTVPCNGPPSDLVQRGTWLLASFWTTAWSVKVMVIPFISLRDKGKDSHAEAPQDCPIACFLPSFYETEGRTIWPPNNAENGFFFSYITVVLLEQSVPKTRFWMDGGSSTFYVTWTGGVKNCELDSFSILTKFVYGIGIYQGHSPRLISCISEMRRRWVKMPLVPRKTP